MELVEGEEDVRRLEWQRQTVMAAACEGRRELQGAGGGWGELTPEEKKLQKEAQKNMAG